jgi:hypothetical protein
MENGAKITRRCEIEGVFLISIAVIQGKSHPLNVSVIMTIRRNNGRIGVEAVGDARASGHSELLG